MTDQDGVLSAAVIYPEGGITFRNTYHDPDPSSPSTGDFTPVMVLMMIVSGAGLATLELFRRKRAAYRR